MNNVSLTMAELIRLLKAFAWVLGIFGLGCFLFRWWYQGNPPWAAAWQAFGQATALDLALFSYFGVAAWRWEWLAALMNRPIVHGVWKGVLESDYQQTDGRRLSIPIIFVVKQTYLTLSVESFTERQEGASRLEALLRNSKTDATRLCYVFELRQQYAGASTLTSGAGELKLSGDQKKLVGTYWTNTPTHGDIRLILVTRDCKRISSYDDAQQRIDA